MEDGFGIIYEEVSLIGHQSIGARVEIRFLDPQQSGKTTLHILGLCCAETGLNGACDEI